VIGTGIRHSRFFCVVRSELPTEHKMSMSDEFQQIFLPKGGVLDYPKSCFNFMFSNSVMFDQTFGVIISKIVRKIKLSSFLQNIFIAFKIFFVMIRSLKIRIGQTTPALFSRMPYIIIH